MIEISPSRASPRAGRVFEWAITQPIVRDDPWHNIDKLCIRALTSERALPPPYAARDRARPAAGAEALHVPQHLTAIEPMGLCSHRQLLLLASHCMALTGERKNPSRIAQEMEISSIFACTARLGAKRDFEVWTYDSDNSTQIQWTR